VDAIEEAKLTLAPLSDNTINTLKSFLPAAANVKNPVDVLGDALADTYSRALEVVLSDENVDAVISILTPQVITQIPETAEKIVHVSRTNKKPVLACFMGGKRINYGANVLIKNGVPNYPFPERAISSIRSMLNYKIWVDKNKGKIINFDADKKTVRQIIAGIKKSGRNTAGDIEGRRILSAYGIKTVESVFAKDVSECKKFFERTGGSVVMKLVSPDILHKTEAGGVKVGLATPDEVEKGFKEIMESAKRYKKDAVIEGVQIQPLISGGTEVIVGVNKDPQFGHLIMFGLGGIYVELLKDVSFRVIPATDVDAEEMVEEIKTIKMLKGFRNIPERDLAAIKDVLLRISQMCCDFPEIEEMDINPLMVFEKGKGTVAVDARFSFNA
jgi:acetate---CoA ligase (ADP-forming)